MTETDDPATALPHSYVPPPWAVARALALAVLAWGLVIAMAEIDRLVRDAVTAGGRTAALSDVLGPLALAGVGQEKSAWVVWAVLADPARSEVGFLIAVHTGLDVVFVVAYASLLYWVLQHRPEAGRVWKKFLVVLLIAEAVEAIGLFWLASRLDSEADVPGMVLAAVTTVKWVSVAALAVTLLRRRQLREGFARGARRVGAAIWVQRLSAVSVVVLGALGLAPAGDIFDQMPDAQRGWLDGGTGALHLGAAFVAVAVFAVVLFVQGRWRAQRAWSTEIFDDPPKDLGWHSWWLVAPVGVGIAALRVWDRTGPDPLVDPQSLAVFLAVPSAVVLASVLLGGYERKELPREKWDARSAGGLAAVLLGVAVVLGFLGPGVVGKAVPIVAAAVVVVAALVGRNFCDKRHWARRSYGVWPPLSMRPGRTRRADDVRRAGDLLAFAMLVVAGLGLVRSFVAPVLDSPGSGRLVGQILLMVFGAVLAVGAPLLWCGLSRRLDADAVLTGGGRRAALCRLLRPEHDWEDETGVLAWAARRVPVLVGGFAVVVLWFLVRHTGSTTGLLGVVGTTVVALGSWSVLLGFFIIYLQDRRPLEVFRFLHMSANPVLSLVAGVLLLVSLSGGDPDLHALRIAPTGSTPAADEQTSGLRARFDAWLAGSEQACNRTVGGTPVQPMLLVAASGGGIRAAVWTTGVLDALQAAGGCAPVATLLSSGVSGGSVGLVLSRGDRPYHAALELAGPDALSAGISGALVGDVAASMTGVRLPSGGDASGWRDRAGLMEWAWERDAETLTEPFDRTVRGPAGALVLNSTAAGPGCRVLVSQITLTPLHGEEAFNCRGDLGMLPATSLDLTAYADCLDPMTWATAAMLSARFPFVTPAGRVDCSAVRMSLSNRTPADLQLVDGGYAEGSAVATVADLAPAVAALVREHNAGVGTTGRPFVVPFVLYLEDETRTELVADAPDLAPELLVPLVGNDAGAQLVRTDAWLQRAGDALADPCSDVAVKSACTTAAEALRAGIPDGVVVAAPATTPGVSSPLGWTLSQDSIDQLRAGLDRQREGCPVPTGHDEQPPPYPCLRTLLDVLDRP